ncbi:hypothetical protein GCM10017779_45240 [Streptomyces capillispiralis]|nr:hypothetical protein GCM10017779_45240 [Streptomyces capillispiralis]
MGGGRGEFAPAATTRETHLSVTLSASVLIASGLRKSPRGTERGRMVPPRVMCRNSGPEVMPWAPRSAASAVSSSSGTRLTTVAAALDSAARGATSSSAAHSAATSTSQPLCSMSSSSSMNTAAARATSRDAFSNCGRVDKRCLSVDRFAALINRVAIRISNRSRASSIASRPGGASPR